MHDLAGWLAGRATRSTILTTHRAATATHGRGRRARRAHRGGRRIGCSSGAPTRTTSARSPVQACGLAARRVRRRARVPAGQRVGGAQGARPRRPAASCTRTWASRPARYLVARALPAADARRARARGAACTRAERGGGRAVPRATCCASPRSCPPGCRLRATSPSSGRAPSADDRLRRQPGGPAQAAAAAARGVRCAAASAVRTRVFSSRAGASRGSSSTFPTGSSGCDGDRTAGPRQDARRRARRGAAVDRGGVRRSCSSRRSRPGRRWSRATPGRGREIVTPAVGRLFEPDDRDSLVAALDEALDADRRARGVPRARAPVGLVGDRAALRGAARRARRRDRMIPADRLPPGATGGVRRIAARGTIINAAFTVGLDTLNLLRGFIVAALLLPGDYGVWTILADRDRHARPAEGGRRRRQVRPAGRVRPGARVPARVHARGDPQRDPARGGGGGAAAGRARVRRVGDPAARARAAARDPGGHAPVAAVGLLPPDALPRAAPAPGGRPGRRVRRDGRRSPRPAPATGASSSGRSRAGSRARPR